MVRRAGESPTETIGVKKILLEDNGVNLFFDFGINFHLHNQYFEEYLVPHSRRGLLDMFHTGLLSAIRNIYRNDLEISDIDIWDRARVPYPVRQIDLVVVYSLDRLSRDPVHGVILTQELEQHHVGLEAVTETVDSTEVGKLITYIRGFADKLEAEKIKERSVRGRKATAREGRMPGGFQKTYGYDYVKIIKGEREARRVINETEASWVRQMFDWLINDGLSTNQILFRLRAHNAPTKNGKIWNRRSVQAILTNPAYTGKTYAFTTAVGCKRFTRPQKDGVGWI